MRNLLTKVVSLGKFFKLAEYFNIERYTLGHCEIFILLWGCGVFAFVLWLVTFSRAAWFSGLAVWLRLRSLAFRDGRLSNALLLSGFRVLCPVLIQHFDGHAFFAP